MYVLCWIRVSLARKSVGIEATYTWERIQKTSAKHLHVRKCTAATGRMVYKVHFGYSCVIAESMQRPSVCVDHRGHEPGHALS